MAKTTDGNYEESLVLRAKARNGAAWSELVQRWHTRLLVHAQRLTRDPHAAEEAVQEAWIIGVKEIEKLNDPSAFGFWMFRIVGRKCAQWVRRRQRSRLHENNAPSPSPQTAPPPPQTATEIEAAMETLSVEHREVVMLHYLEEWNIEQIAERLNLKTGTVKSRLHYAREALRRKLDNRHG